MGTISVSLPSDGDTIDAADYNTPINTIVNLANGNIDNANIAAAAAIAGTKLADSAISTAKIADDAATDAKLVYGKVRGRRGGSSTIWSTAGTTNYDTSAVDTFVQCGAAVTSSGAVTITFPNAFTYAPIVTATVASASAANCFVRITAITTTTCILTAITDGGSLAGAENVNWIAIGQ